MKSPNDLTRHLLRLNDFAWEASPFFYLKPIEEHEDSDGNDMYEFYKCLLKAQAFALSIPVRSIMALDELVRTEEAYIRDLNTLVDVFVLPYYEAVHVKILPISLMPDIVQSLFGNLIELSRLHTEFIQVSHTDYQKAF